MFLNDPSIECGKRFDSMALSLVAFFYTLAWNWSSPGPVYLSDTVAYLVNAAILAGHHVDAMGSWHAGYSILLAPLFLLDDPFLIWKGVQIINAALVGLAVYLSSALLDHLRPDLDRLDRAACLVVIILYPAFSAIAGWAFSSSILSVNVLFIGLYLAKNKTWGARQALLLGLMAGFAYWIHPTGFVVISATLVALFFRMASIRWIPGLAYLLTCFVMVWVYKNGIHEALYRIVTPDGFGRFDHYQGAAFSHLLSIDGILRFFTLSAGHLSYQLVSTLGLVWVGAWYGIRMAVRWLKDAGSDTDQENKNVATAVFAVLLVVGAISAITLAFSGSPLGRTDYWIYGRYTDAVVHPLLVVGLLAFVSGDRNIKSNYWIWGGAALVLLVLGGYLRQAVDTQLPHSHQSTLAFWPQYILENKNFLNWMLLGSAGIALMALIGRLRKRALLAALFIIFSLNACVSGFHNLDDRKALEANYSQPSAIVEVVRSTWPRGACVGFAHPLPAGLSLMQRERYRMYAFYFFNYNYRRYTLENWRDNCSGPLLTFDPAPIFNDPEFKIILREESTGLFLVSRKHEQVTTESALHSKFGEVELVTNMTAKCLVAGCFSMDGLKLSKFSQAGVLDANYLKTDGRAGYLFYGPYRRMASGNYEVVFDLDTKSGDEAVFDVVSAGGAKSHARIQVSSAVSGPGKARIPFFLNEAVHDLEIRLHVGKNDQISVVGYKVQADPTHIQ